MGFWKTMFETVWGTEDMVEDYETESKLDTTYQTIWNKVENEDRFASILGLPHKLLSKVTEMFQPNSNQITLSNKNLDTMLENSSKGIEIEEEK